MIGFTKTGVIFLLDCLILDLMLVIIMVCFVPNRCNLFINLSINVEFQFLTWLLNH